MTPEEAYRRAFYQHFRLSSKLEDIILTSPFYTYCYALNVVKGRWRKAEDIIVNDAHCATYYACNLVKGRWKKAEDMIANSDYNAEYIEIVFRSKPSIDYASKSSFGLYIYAKNVIKGRLPTELHNIMLCFAIVEPNAHHIKTYFKSKKYQ